ncbi:MAG: YsnF/AvaK domain-containing protein [Clostridiaceae bacterium]|nr:YsnF/AvaK domain-containing protein [Clostridiaceae bacterium]
MVNNLLVPQESENVTFKVKQEEFDIAKKWVETGEVKVYRETFKLEKSFTVPVIREELVIEKKSLTSDIGKNKDVPPEVIRIPLSEEEVKFTKHRINLEDVSIYKEQVEYIKHIEETLKHEEPKVKIFGSPKVRDKSNTKLP